MLHIITFVDMDETQCDLHRDNIFTDS